MMKAIRVAEFGLPEVLQVAETPVPCPGAGQVVIKIMSAGVNPVDTYIRTGTHSRRPQLPYTPGSDAAGIVTAIGPDVTNFKEGDRVYATGTISGSYAQYALCDAKQVHPLPDHVSFDEGAALHIPYYTAYAGLVHYAKILPSETVLIHGATGAVGLAAVQWAHSFGCTVIGTAGTPEGEELVLQNGATFVVNHREPNYTQQIMTYTKGKGVDVILEMVANQNLSKDLSMLAFRGRVVVIGSRGSVEINPRDTMSKRSTIMGLLLFNYTPEEKNELDEAHQKALRQGILKPSIGPIYKLVDSPQAHIEVIDRASAAQGKIIIHPWD